MPKLHTERSPHEPPLTMPVVVSDESVVPMPVVVSDEPVAPMPVVEPETVIIGEVGPELDIRPTVKARRFR